MRNHIRASAKRVINRALYSVIPKFSFDSDRWRIQELNIKGKQAFCGYYDLCPFSKHEDGLLIHVADRKANPKVDEVTLGLYFLDSNEFIPIHKSRKWCWQLGARLGWLSHKEQLIIANTGDDRGSRASIWQHRDGNFRLVQKIPMPLFDWSPTAGLGSSLNFTRLGEKRPGYGFDQGGTSNCHLEAPDDDGVFVVNLNNETHELVFSLAEAARITSKPHNSFSYINHQSWNPSGTRLLFFIVNQSADSRRSHAIVIDPNGENLWSLDQTQFINVSHYRWISDSEFILTATTRDHGFSYFLVKDGGELSEHVRLPSPLIDGHPSLLPTDPQTILTDSYPDRWNAQSLFTFHRHTGDKNTIAKFYSPMSFVADRKCDLHPRVSLSGKKICVDTCYTGQRGVSVLHSLAE